LIYFLIKIVDCFVGYLNYTSSTALPWEQTAFSLSNDALTEPPVQLSW